MKNKILLSMTALVLGACASAPEGPKIGEVKDLYNQGMDAMMAGEQADAIHTFEELERQHPYSGWATRAQMMVAYAHFQAKEYEEAIVAAERFVRLHPGHPDLDYMYYLRAMSFYVQLSDVARDQGHTRQALAAFEEITRRFPDSQYARDARFKTTLCKDHLAAKEMQIGRYYLKKERFMAAINRFKAVVDEYQTSSQTAEALYRLTEAYLALGVTDEAKRAAAILGHNYPNNEWYKKAYRLMTQKNLAPEEEPAGWGTGVLKSLGLQN